MLDDWPITSASPPSRGLLRPRCRRSLLASSMTAEHHSCARPARSMLLVSCIRAGGVVGCEMAPYKRRFCATHMSVHAAAALFDALELSDAAHDVLEGCNRRCCDMGGPVQARARALVAFRSRESRAAIPYARGCSRAVSRARESKKVAESREKLGEGVILMVSAGSLVTWEALYTSVLTTYEPYALSHSKPLQP